MAEGDGQCYQNFKADIMAGVYDLGSGGDTLKVMLGNTYTPDWDVHATKALVDAAWTELSGTGYSAGGKTLAGQTVTESGTGSGTAIKGKFDGTDLMWTAIDAGTPNYAVMYDDTPTSPADPLIAAWEVTTPTNGGNYTLNWHTNGIIRIS